MFIVRQNLVFNYTLARAEVFLLQYFSPLALVNTHVLCFRKVACSRLPEREYFTALYEISLKFPWYPFLRFVQYDV